MIPKPPFLFFFLGVGITFIALIFKIFNDDSEVVQTLILISIFCVTTGIFIRVTWND